MQNVSQLYKYIISSQNHWFETSVVIGETGDLVTEYGEKILFGGAAILVARTGPDSGFPENYIFSVKTDSRMLQDNLRIGTCVAQEVEVKMLNPAGNMPRMSVVIPYVRAAGNIQREDGWSFTDDIMMFYGNVSIDNSILTFAPEFGARTEKSIIVLPSNTEYAESEWIQQGVFFIDTREVTHNGNGLDILTIHGYDAMLKANQDYSESNIDWPATDIDVVKEIADIIDVDVDPRTYNIMTDGYQITYPSNYTLIDVLSYIASMYLGSFIITETGELRLVSLLELPPETRYLIDLAGDVITFGGDRILV